MSEEEEQQLAAKENTNYGYINPNKVLWILVAMMVFHFGFLSVGVASCLQFGRSAEFKQLAIERRKADPENSTPIFQDLPFCLKSPEMIPETVERYFALLLALMAGSSASAYSALKRKMDEDRERQESLNN
jgi:hypothetical protein